MWAAAAPYLVTIGSSILAGMLGNKGSQSYRKAGKEINRGWNEASGYMKPYQEAGLGQLPGLQEAISKLLSPEGLQNKWAEGYAESPYAKDALKRSNDIGLDNASSMGLSGSSAALENLQRTGSSIMNQDRQQYLNDLMQKYMMGLQGSGGIYGAGANMAGALGQGAITSSENIAKMKYGQNSATGDMFSSLLGSFLGGYGQSFGKTS